MDIHAHWSSIASYCHYIHTINIHKLCLHVLVFLTQHIPDISSPAVSCILCNFMITGRALPPLGMGMALTGLCLRILRNVKDWIEDQCCWPFKEVFCFILTPGIFELHQQVPEQNNWCACFFPCFFLGKAHGYLFPPQTSFMILALLCSSTAFLVALWLDQAKD